MSLYCSGGKGAVSCHIAFYNGNRSKLPWKLPRLPRKLLPLPRRLPPLQWKRMEVSTKAVEASMEALETSMEVSEEASTVSMEASVEDASMKNSMDLWKLPREVWSTSAEEILPEASGCFQLHSPLPQKISKPTFMKTRVSFHGNGGSSRGRSTRFHRSSGIFSLGQRSTISTTSMKSWRSFHDFHGSLWKL